ncbi:hypothetical protein T09_2759 [Trichinella sp. T9]|nr:hypothetical protein T09_2759 [Trichinella sp. T9]
MLTVMYIATDSFKVHCPGRLGVEQKSRSTCSFSPQYNLQFQKWSVNNVVRDECTMESMRIFLNNFGVLPLHNPLSNILSNSLSKIPMLQTHKYHINITITGTCIKQPFTISYMLKFICMIQ